MLFFERKRKAVDDRTKDFQKLGDAIVPFGFVDELEESIVDRTPDERA